MRAWSLPVLLYLMCSVLSAVVAYPDRSTLQIVRQLLDRVKDIDEVHIVEAKLLSDPKLDGFGPNPNIQQTPNRNHPSKPEAAASSPRQVVATNDPRQQMMFVDVGSILGMPHLGVLRVPLGPSPSRAQGRQWIPPNHSPAESQRLNLVASPTQNVSRGNQTNAESPQASRSQRVSVPHSPQQHQQNRKPQHPQQQPPFREQLHHPIAHFPVVIFEATVARETHTAPTPHARPGVTGIHMGILQRSIKSNPRPQVASSDFNLKVALPSNAAPQMRPPSAQASTATDRHSPPAWAPATALAEPAEFSQIPTLTANPVHRSPMASVRRLFGRPDEENIVITLPQPTNPPVRANPQPVPQQQTTTTEPPKTRNVIRSKLFPQSTRKPSRRLIFKYLG